MCNLQSLTRWDKFQADSMTQLFCRVELRSDHNFILRRKGCTRLSTCFLVDLLSRICICISMGVHVAAKWLSWSEGLVTYSARVRFPFPGGVVVQFSACHVVTDLFGWYYCRPLNTGLHYVWCRRCVEDTGGCWRDSTGMSMGAKLHAIVLITISMSCWCGSDVRVDGSRAIRICVVCTDRCQWRSGT